MHGDRERRTGVRLPVNIPVELVFGRTTHNMQTLDVSIQGVFVVTDRPPPLHQLVSLKAIVPPSYEKVSLRGMVMHSVSGDEARERMVPAGMGILFYGLGEAARAKWASFFDGALADLARAGGVAYPPTPLGGRALQRQEADLDEIDTEATLPRPPKAPTAALVPAPRAGEFPLGLAAPVLYRMEPKSVDALVRFRSVALEVGGVVLLGVGAERVGQPVVVAVVHPTTRFEFHVPGLVERVDPDRRGVAVRLLGVTERAKHEFSQFAQLGKPPPPASSLGSAEHERVMFESAEEVQWDLVMARGRAVSVDDLVPLESAHNPYRPQGRKAR